MSPGEHQLHREPVARRHRAGPAAARRRGGGLGLAADGRGQAGVQAGGADLVATHEGPQRPRAPLPRHPGLRVRPRREGGLERPRLLLGAAADLRARRSLRGCMGLRRRPAGGAAPRAMGPRCRPTAPRGAGAPARPRPRSRGRRARGARPPRRRRRGRPATRARRPAAPRASCPAGCSAKRAPSRVSAARRGASGRGPAGPAAAARARWPRTTRRSAGWGRPQPPRSCTRPPSRRSERSAWAGSLRCRSP